MSRAPFSNETTSLEAASQVEARAGTQLARVLEHLRTVGPSTHEEIATATGIGIRQVATRVRRLVLDGKARDSGEARVSRAGFAVIVWQAHAGPPISPEKQTHGRIAAAVRRTWEEAAKIAQAEAERRALDPNPRLLGFKLATIFAQKAQGVG